MQRVERDATKLLTGQAITKLINGSLHFALQDAPGAIHWRCSCFHILPGQTATQEIDQHVA